MATEVGLEEIEIKRPVSEPLKENTMTFKVEKSWVTKAGLPAVVVWVNDSHRCGYVELTKDSIFYGITDEREVHPTIHKSINDLDVHGGVTFFGTSYWIDSDTEDSNFFVGFDCAHAGDATRYSPAEGILRSLDYCTEECERLAKQLMSTDPVAALVVALEEIIAPIPFMKKRLQVGEQLNGLVAVQLAEDAEYLRDIAYKAVTAYRKQKGDL